jgi:hypothetical protein
VEPKLLPFPFDTEQPFEYNVRRCPTLEETYAYGLHTEIDVGVPINLVDPAVYEPPKAGAPLHDLDKYITNPSFGTAVSLKRLPGLVLFAVVGLPLLGLPLLGLLCATTGCSWLLDGSFPLARSAVTLVVPNPAVVAFCCWLGGQCRT